MDSLSSQDEKEGTTTGELARRGLRPATPYIFAIVSLGILLGFTLGLILFKAPWSPASRPTVLYDEELVTSLFERAGPAVVEISVIERRGGIRSRPLVRESTGSGFLVDTDGHIVTNHHVVEAQGDITVTLYDGRTLPATKLGSSPLDDLALLKVEPTDVAGIAPLPLADSKSVKPGQMAVAIGTPFRERNSVTVGVVSGVGRSRLRFLERPVPDLVQTDAALNPGNSGGPLLNSAGEVIGVTTAVQIVNSAQIGVGYAISSDTLSSILADLMEPGEFKRPYLGISGIELTPQISNALGLAVEEGIYIAQVANGSLAQAARLRGDTPLDSNSRGDVIIAVDGRSVGSVAEMVAHFNTLRPGDEVTLTVLRDNRTQDIDVTLAEWPDT